MKKLALILACAVAAVTPTVARAATLTIPVAVTVNGVDVFAGPQFTVSGNFGLADTFALTADGEVGLAGTQFFANAAGVITRPDTTNTGAHPGGVTLSGGIPTPHCSSATAPWGSAPCSPPTRPTASGR